MAHIVKYFACTRAVQTWVAPTGVTSVIVELWGASGGADGGSGDQPTNQSSYPTKTTAYWSGQFDGPVGVPSYWAGGSEGGSGPVGYVKGTWACTPGTSYSVIVGGNGGNGSTERAGGFLDYARYTSVAVGGYNGGGAGGRGYQPGVVGGQVAAYGGGGGGGFTEFKDGGTGLLLAAGSGGAGGGWSSRNVTALSPTQPGAAVFLAVQYASNPITPPYSSDPATTYFISGAGMAGYGGGGNGERGTSAASYGSLAPGVEAKAGATGIGGAGGTNTETGGVSGSVGSPGAGGAGGASNLAVNVLQHGGGGGGGGHMGGGGGANGLGQQYGCGGGGGGGNNYFHASVTNTVNAPHLWADVVPDPVVVQTPDAPGAPTSPNQYTPDPAVTTYPGGFAILTYEQPPLVPIIVSPVPNQRMAATQPFTFEWIIQGADAVSGEGGADIVYTQLATPFTAVTVHVNAQIAGPAHGQRATYVLPASTLTVGRSYSVKIRTYDDTGLVSAYQSVLPTLRVVAAPTAPVVTEPDPDDDLDPDSWTVTWTNPNGAGTELLYRVYIVGNETGHVFDTGLKHSGTRLNLSPDPTMKASSASWTATSGTKTVDAKNDPWGVPNCYKVAWTTKTRFTVPVATVPGVKYCFSGYFASAASTDPAMAIAAVDPTTLVAIGQSETVAVHGTPGNWQRLSVVFTAIGGSTLLAFIPVGGSTTSSYFSSSMVEIGAALDPYFGTATSKDAAVTGTITTTADGFQTVAGTDILSDAQTNAWLTGSEPAAVTVEISTLASGEFTAGTTVEANMNDDPPGVPSVTISADSTAGSISLNVTVVDTPNPTNSVDIYRSVVGLAGSEIRVARLVPDVTRAFVWVDYTPATDTLYQYRVKANSLAGGFKSAT